MAKQTRYPGIKPFETNEAHLFFGRKRDIQDLYDLITVEKLVVLFAKSGYGKSSLLNAGILSKLTAANTANNINTTNTNTATNTATASNDSDETDENAVWQRRVLTVRLGNFNPERTDENGAIVQPRSPSPLETLAQKLDEKAAKTPETAFMEGKISADTLWYQFKRRQATHTEYVLLFDQFEEFFSYPLAEQTAFKQQMATLLYETIPQAVRDASAGLPRTERVTLAKPMQIRTVFAIRSDRMSFLDSMKDHLPAILHKRYELKSLSPEQAREAIKQPAEITTGEFASAPFEYTEIALDAMINRLQNADNADEKKQGIEAFLLQLLCEDIENKVMRNEVTDIDGNGLPDITLAHLPDMSMLLENYYQRKLTDLGALRATAQRVLEDGLLAEDVASGDARRMSVDSESLKIQFGKLGLTDALLQSLSNTFLIRGEPNTTGGTSYEISHDTLLAPILRSKQARRTAETAEADRRAAEIAAAALEAEIQAQKARAAELERLTRQAQGRTRIAVGVAVVAIIAMIFAAWQYYIGLMLKDAAEMNSRLSHNLLQRSIARDLMASAEGYARLSYKRDLMLAQYAKADSIIHNLEPNDGTTIKEMLIKELAAAKKRSGLTK
jgi:hypothetical protein